MGDTEYVAAFQQIVMPVAYEVCISVSCRLVLLIVSARYAFLLVCVLSVSGLSVCWDLG